MKIIAYHCPCCGGATDPYEKICRYCLSEMLRREKKRRNVRVLVNCGEDYVYFDDIISIQKRVYPNIVSARDLGGEYHLMRSRPDITYDVDMIVTERSLKLCEMIDMRTQELRIEFLKQDRAIETRGYSSIDIQMYSNMDVQTASMTFHTFGDEVLFNTVVPEGLTCPNCGALITSKYGACDYCGGWVEWEGK